VRFFDRIKESIREVCRTADERYEDICRALEEDVLQYEDLYESLRRKFGRGGGE